MPLTTDERRRLNDCLNGMTAPAVMGDTDGGGSGLDRLASAIARFAEVIAPAIERAVAGAEGEGMGEPPATDAPRRRGRKPAAGADGAAATQAPGATAPTSAPASVAQSGGQVATTQTHRPAQADLGGFADDPLDETPAGGNGEAIPGFLDRSKQQAAPAPTPPTAQAVKDVLKQYMEKKGPTGTADLTALLMKIGKVKKFAELDPSKYGEIMTTARAEAGLS